MPKSYRREFSCIWRVNLRGDPGTVCRVTRGGASIGSEYDESGYFAVQWPLLCFMCSAKVLRIAAAVGHAILTHARNICALQRANASGICEAAHDFASPDRCSAPQFPRTPLAETGGSPLTTSSGALVVVRIFGNIIKHCHS